MQAVHCEAEDTQILTQWYLIIVIGGGTMWLSNVNR